MRVAVELTYDDFSEASAAVRKLVAEKQRRAARRSPWLVLASFATGVALFLALTIGSTFQIDPLWYLRPPLYWAITLLMPAVVIAIFAMVLGAVQREVSGKRLLALLVPLAVLALLAWLLHLVSGERPRFKDEAGSDWLGTLVPHMPWVLITAIVATLVAKSMRAQTRIAWDAYAPHLRRKVYEIEAAGVSVDEGVSRQQYAWAAFARFLETPNLLLLCPTDLTFEVLPKRDFASSDDLNAARQLFGTLIHDPAARATPGFPIVTLGPAGVAATRAHQA